MTDIVERLRAWRSPLKCHHGAVYALASEAASVIKRLEAENAALRERVSVLEHQLLQALGRGKET